MVTTTLFASHMADGIILGIVAVTITYITGWTIGKLLKLVQGKGV